MGFGKMFDEEQMGLRALLWAGLRWEDRGLTPERAGALISVWFKNGGSLAGL